MMMWPVMMMPMILVGMLLPFMAQTRRGILFGVTVPVEFAESGEGRGAVRVYRWQIAALVAVCLGMALAGRATGHVWLGTIGVPLELVGGFALWRVGAARVRGHRVMVPLERSTALHAGSDGMPASVFTVLALVPLGLDALWLRAHEGLAPERIAIHYNAAGEANRWVSRAHGGLYLPVLMGGVMVMLMFGFCLFLRWIPGGQKRTIAVVQSGFAVLAWVLASMFIGLSVMPLLQAARRPMLIGTMVVCEMMAVVAVVVWMAWRLRETAKQEHDGTPDAKWYGGIFYYNAEDAAVLVPKRFGWGWTLNFARPAAWIYLAVVLGVVGLMAALPKILR